MCLALWEGDTAAAERYHRQSIAAFTELGARGDLAESLTALGKLHMYCSAYEDAQKVFKDAIRLGLESNTMPQVYEATVELADCLLQLGDPHEASRLAMSVLQGVFPCFVS